MSNQIQISNVKFQVQENVALAPLTTFKIGGPARFFVMVTTKNDLSAALNWAEEKNLLVLIMGGGSNLLVPDEGWAGLVVRVAIGGWNFKELRTLNSELRTYLINVGAGVSMTAVAQEATRRGLTGLEWAGGLPGTVGGAVRGNAGAFRFDIGQVVKAVEVLRQNKIIKLNQSECGFGYRTSYFKNNNKDDIILSVELELVAGNPRESQKQLEYYQEHRQKSQPLQQPSAGCIFKNVLIMDKTQIGGEFSQIHRLPEEFVKYKKIPAGWLVEQVGMKGARVGEAQVSPQHANFIVNLGQATALDVLNLIRQIKEKVYNKFQIELEEEIKIIQIPVY